jgi:ankyrin repeat protein
MHEFVRIALAGLALSIANAPCTAASSDAAQGRLRKLRESDYFAGSAERELAKAVASGDTERAALLVKQGVDVNVLGRDDMRMLFWALIKDSVKGFEFLLRNGATPNAATKVGSERATPLIELAALYEKTDFLQLLLKFGCDPNTSVNYGNRTVIYQAIINERYDGVRLLIEAGADLAHQDSAGDTPVMTAAAADQYRIVYLCLAKGANPEIQNRFGYDLVARMQKYGTRGIDPGSDETRWHEEVVRELKKRGIWR